MGNIVRCMGTIVPAYVCIVYIYDIGNFMCMYTLVYNYKFTVTSYVYMVNIAKLNPRLYPRYVIVALGRLI